MSWNVTYKRKLERNLKKLPIEVQALFQVLIQDLEATGPEQISWLKALNLEAISIIAI